MDVVGTSAPSPRRTKRRGRHPDKALSAAFVRSAPPGRHADGNGLYLFVQPSGTRSWVQRLVIRGRRRELGLGAATLVPLAKAREKALATACWPGPAAIPSRETAPSRTFRPSPKPPAVSSSRSAAAGAAGGTFTTGGGAWSGTCSPASAAGPSPRSTRPTCWRSSHRSGTSRRRRPGRSAAHPCGAGVGDRARHAERQPMRPGGAGARPAERHRDASAGAAAQDVAAAIETVRNGSAQPAVRLAFEFLVLTAARSGEVRLATWDEIDTAGAVWTVPATRMKAKREHRVPLCGRALEVLDAARALGDDDRLVFPMRSGRRLPRRRSRRCCSTTRWPPCRTASGRASGLGGRGDGPPAGRSSRRRSPMSFRTRSRRPTRGRTCSSGGGP